MLELTDVHALRQSLAKAGYVCRYSDNNGCIGS